MFIEHLLASSTLLALVGERDQSVVGRMYKTRAQHCADYRPSGCTKEGSSWIQVNEEDFLGGMILSLKAGTLQSPRLEPGASSRLAGSWS